MHGGPQSTLLTLGLTLEMLRTTEHPEIENHNASKTHAYELYQQQQTHARNQKIIKSNKPQHYGKSSTPIQKYRGHR